MDQPSKNRVGRQAVGLALFIAIAWLAVSTALATDPPARASRVTLAVSAGVDDASEAVRPRAQRPSTTARSLRLGRGRLSGLRFVAMVPEPGLGASVGSSLLRLALARPTRRETAFRLRIAIGLPNDPAFSRTVPGDISRRIVVGEIGVDVHLAPGATEIELPNVLNGLLDMARAATRDGAPAWVPGAENSLILLLSSDDLPRTVRLGSLESNRPASLELCLGACPLEDADRDGRLTVACVGDSNTASFSDWCSLVADMAVSEAWSAHVGGAGGTGAGLALVHADAVIARMAAELGGARPDAILFAYGTNDASAYWDPPYGDGTYDPFLARLAAAKSHVEQLGIRFGVALAPPVGVIPGGLGSPSVCTEQHQARIEGFNQRVADRFASQAFGFVPAIDMSAGDFRDCLHLSDAGALKRARAAYEALGGG